ncbi:hypothetical protein ACRN9F_19580 [Shewanella oncorhynchi]|uniref:hypothetical protein n=1 Tax=Shewanella oncorhynchi TaxID=2726434 RepID=UPI003D79E7D8
MVTWIIETLLMLTASASIFLAFIAVLFFLQRLVCSLVVRNFGNRSIYLSAIVGTPIHEISHAIACILFRHKVLEVALFKPDGAGTLGYVHHSYNPLSLWQQIGNFFIGTAPLVGGTASIYFLTYLLLPNSQEIFEAITSSTSAYQNVRGATSFVVALLSELTDISRLIYLAAKEVPYRFALWTYLTGAIALHLSPSPADMKGSVKGFLLILLLLTAFRLTSSSASDNFFSALSGALLSLSVTYSLCILLAAILATAIFTLSLITKR